MRRSLNCVRVTLDRSRRSYVSRELRKERAFPWQTVNRLDRIVLTPNLGLAENYDEENSNAHPSCLLAVAKYRPDDTSLKWQSQRQW